jgi:hypothetical protein
MQIVLDVSALTPNIATVDALARLRRRQAFRLRGVSEELRQLIALCGLADVLRVEGIPRVHDPNELGGGP